MSVSRLSIDKPIFSIEENGFLFFPATWKLGKRNDFLTVQCSSTGIQLSSRLPKVPRQEKCLAIIEEESSGYKVLIQIVKETAAAMRVTLHDRIK